MPSQDIFVLANLHTDIIPDERQREAYKRHAKTERPQHKKDLGLENWSFVNEGAHFSSGKTACA